MKMQTRLDNIYRKFNITKQSILPLLVAVLAVTSVLMNQLAGFRPFYNEGSAGIWRAISFPTVALSWIPLLIGDILADRYNKRTAILVPAFIFLIQGLIWVVAIAAGNTSESWQNLWAGVFGNYAGLFANFFVFIGLKKLIGTDKWYTLAAVAVVSTVFGQFADNIVYMSLSPFQWAGNVFEGGKFFALATEFTSVNILNDLGEWTGRATKGWDGFLLKSVFEIGMEVIAYPITLFVISQIKRLQ